MISAHPVQTEDSQKRVNGDVSKKSSVPSRYHQFMTSEDETRSESSSAHSSDKEEEEEEEVGVKGKTPANSLFYKQSISPIRPQLKSDTPVSPAPVKETSQVLQFPPLKNTDQIVC